MKVYLDDLLRTHQFHKCLGEGCISFELGSDLAKGRFNPDSLLQTTGGEIWSRTLGAMDAWPRLSGI